MLSAFPLAFLLEIPPVRYLGRISYGVYLLHIPFFDLMDRALGRFHLPVTLLLFGKLLGLILLASTSWHFFESQLIVLGARWTSRSRMATNAANTAIPGNAIAEEDLS